MNRNDKLRVLRLAALTDGIDESTVQLLADGSEAKKLEKKEVLWIPDAVANETGLVVVGRLDVWVNEPQGRTRVVGSALAGELISVAAGLNQLEHYGKVSAGTDATLVLIVPRDTLLGAIQAEPQVAINLVRHLGNVVREHSQTIALLRSKTPLAEQLTAMLRRLSNNGKKEVWMTATEIAAYVGFSRQKVSEQLRTIDAFRSERIGKDTVYTYVPGEVVVT